jgi:uncharacterized membrane protein YozB (DUF420 family)
VTKIQVNRISSIAFTGFSLIALFTVLSAYIGPPPAPQADEGTAAHIFQLAVVLAAASLLTLLATMDWRRPWRALRSLGLPGVALVTAFIVLYHLEHYH